MADSRTIRFDVPEVVYDRWCDLRDRYSGDHRHLAAAVVLDPPDEQLHVAAQGADDLAAFVEDGGEVLAFSADDHANADHPSASEPSESYSVAPTPTASDGGSAAVDGPVEDTDEEEADLTAPDDSSPEAEAVAELVSFLQDRGKPASTQVMENAVPWTLDVYFEDIEANLRAHEAVVVEEDDGRGTLWRAAPDE